MDYSDKALPTARDKKPAAHYFNPITGQFEVATGRNGGVSFHEQGTVMVDMWSGSTDITKTFSKECQTFAVINDGDSDIDVAIDNFNFTVKRYESFEGKFPPFTELSITTSSTYRAYVKE